MEGISELPGQVYGGDIGVERMPHKLSFFRVRIQFGCKDGDKFSNNGLFSVKA
jgi:hypothetical protein